MQRKDNLLIKPFATNSQTLAAFLMDDVYGLSYPVGRQEGMMAVPVRFPGGHRPTDAQLRYLRRGLRQPGGKLPIFDEHGQQISANTITSCIKAGWAEPWFDNPIKPDWIVCKLTREGRALFDMQKSI